MNLCVTALSVLYQIDSLRVYDQIQSKALDVILFLFISTPFLDQFQRYLYVSP